MPSRERYFTPETIDLLAADMLLQAAGRGARRPLPYLPSRSALLLLDLQHFFIDEDSHACVPSAQAILPRIARIAVAYEGLGLPVIFTRHENTPADAGQMAVHWRDLIAPGSPAAEIVFHTGGNPVVVKHQYDAFYRTGLEALLRERGVEQVLITGVMTHLCCETTARSAFMRGFAVFFVVDGTATYTEAFHRASLLNLAHGFATPMLSAQVLTALKDEAADDDD